MEFSIKRERGSVVVLWISQFFTKKKTNLYVGPWLENSIIFCNDIFNLKNIVKLKHSFLPLSSQGPNAPALGREH